MNGRAYTWTPIDLYDHSYSQSAARVFEEIRHETYGLDLGQTGWMTAEEFRSFIDLLGLTPRSRVLEVGCGAGGCALYLAQSVGASVVGIDINENGIVNARTLADAAGLNDRLHFQHADAARTLPFSDESFHAVFSNDAMCHIANRLEVLNEWRRVLKPDGRMLFTDAMVITGLVSNEEIAVRSSIGYYVFLPRGENERLIAASGLRLTAATDLTASAEAIAGRWRNAREQRREDLLKIEGERDFSGLQRFLACVHTLSKERRLSRFSYLASRPAARGATEWTAPFRAHR